MLDYFKLIIVGVITGIVLAAIGGLWSCRHWIAWRWRRYRASRGQRSAEREQYLNEPVKLTTGEFIHRGCAGSKDKIARERIIPLGGCTRCGEHGSRPRAKV